MLIICLQHIEQHDQKYNECNRDLENLGKENEDLQEVCRTNLLLKFKIAEIYTLWLCWGCIQYFASGE